jgi:CBS domain containing-hemolysin-like protein
MQKLQSEPASAIGAIQVCITMTNLLLGWIGEPAMSAVLGHLFGPVIQWWPTGLSILSVALSFLIVTHLTVVFSELLPKTLTLRYVGLAAGVTAVPILAIRRAIWPLVWLMNATANLVTRPLGLGRVDSAEDRQVTVDELRVMTLQAAAAGELKPVERSLVLGALSIGKRQTREIMVHRTKVTYLDLRRSMEENLRVLEEPLYTRLPLCDGDMDHVVGVVLTKEFLTAYRAQGKTPMLRLIARPAVFIPELVTLDRLLVMLRETPAGMVFVVDEYGGVEGIVTLRDVVDELLADAPKAR